MKHIRTVFGTILEAAVMQEILVRESRPQDTHGAAGPGKGATSIAPETLKALIEKLAEPSRSIAKVLAVTGLRIGELLALRWQDVDLQKGFLRFARRSMKAISTNPKAGAVNAAFR